jgi:Zn-dependent protease
MKFGGEGSGEFGAALMPIIGMNIGLAFFNLIPCPPLDGGAILHGIMPRDLEWITETLQRYGFMIFFALFATGALTKIMTPAMHLAGMWIRFLGGLA